MSWHSTFFGLWVGLKPRIYVFFLSLDGRKGGQASSEDLFPLGYGEWERTKVRVKFVSPSL
jgi:hypothetical protein